MGIREIFPISKLDAKSWPVSRHLAPSTPGYLLTTYESFPDQWNNKVPPNFPTILSFFRPHLESFVAEKRGEEEEEGRNGVIGR